jgi:hypothetical protein
VFGTAVVTPASSGATCNTTGGMSFSWSVTDGAGSAVTVSSALPTLALAARSLAVGTSASAALRVCYAAQASSTNLCGQASVAFTVKSTPLVVVLSGGGGLVGEQPVIIDASASRDPDGEPGALALAWSCATASGAACLAPDGTAVALQAGATAQTITLLGDGSGIPYTISVTATKGVRTSSASTSLTVKSGALPLIAVQGLSSPLVLATDRLVLRANVTSRAPATVRTLWSVSGTPALNLSSPLIAATPLTSASLVLVADALQPGASYVFRLTATDSDGEAFAELAVPVAAAPLGADGSPAGLLAVSPSSGTALETRFTLTASAWAGDGPLLYAFSYRVSPDADLVAVSAFQPSPSVSVTLPAGATGSTNVLSLFVTVMSAAGAVSAAAANATADVAFRVFSSPAEMNSYSAALADSAAAALASGDPEAALQLVGGLAALLFSATGPPPPPPPPGGDRSVSDVPVVLTPEQLAAQQARISQRENLLSIVSSATGVPTSPAAAATTVSLVNSIVSSTPAAEMSPAASNKALGAFCARVMSAVHAAHASRASYSLVCACPPTDIVSSITGSGVALTPAAVAGIANALSALGGAAASTAATQTATARAAAAASRSASTRSAGRSGSLLRSDASTRTAALTTTCTLLTRVVHVLDSLTKAQLSGMVVPGEQASTLSTSNIKAYTALDAVADTSARLFTQPTTVAGAITSFAPLSAAALAAALAAAPDGLATGVGVSFYDLAFDPWDCGSSNSSAVTRMALSSSTGNELNVNHLEELITFELAAPAADVASEALFCAWWDADLGVYSTAGCVALPNPAPVDAVLAFSGDLSGALERAWTASGPLFDGCAAEFLDCASAPADAVLLPDPEDAVGTPGIGCMPGSNDVLRVYSGAACAARKPGNAADCYWDALTQAFAGDGCVLASTLKAGATHLTDFTAFHMPRSPLALPSQRVADVLSPAGITTLWTRLRWMVVTVGSAALLTTVFAAAVHFIIDRRVTKAALTAVQTRRLGFSRKPGGVWTWMLSSRTQTQTGKDTDPGPLAALAALAGVPPARLRLAIPEELLSGSLAAVLGRRAARAAARAAAAAPKPTPPRRGRRSLGPLPRSVRPPALDVSAATLQLMGDDDAQGNMLPSPDSPTYDEPPSPSVRASRCPRPWRGSTLDCEASGLEAETLASTALVFAFLSARRLIPPGELAKRRSAAAAYFIGEEERATDAGALGVFDFEDLVRKFAVLLAGDSLRGERDWLGAARMWRLALLQERDGSWDASAGLAFALHATAPAPGARASMGASDPLAASPDAIAVALPPALQRLRDGRDRNDARMSAGSGLVRADVDAATLERLRTSTRLASQAAANAADAALAQEAATAALASTRRDGLLALLRAAQGGGDADDEDTDDDAATQASLSDAGAADALGAVEERTRRQSLLALAGTSGAIRPSVAQPSWLLPSAQSSDISASAADALAQDDFPVCGPLDIERVWATALAVAAADSMDFAYVALPPSRRNPVGATVVDLGLKWLEEAAEEEPLLRAALPHVLDAAAAQVRQWSAAHAARVAPLRRAEAATPAAAAKAAAARADAAKAALKGGIAPASAGYRTAWQRLVSASTLGATVLAVVVGMVAHRADACCVQLREVLGCDPDDFSSPCRGIAGDQCAQLEATFRGLRGSPASGLACSAFPAPASWPDRLFAAVLVAAVTLPLKLFLGACWDASSEAADPTTMHAWRSREHGLLLTLLTGSWRHIANPTAPRSRLRARGWRIAGEHAPSALRRFAAGVMRAASAPVTFGLDLIVDTITNSALLIVRPPRSSARRGVQQPYNTAAAAAGAAHAMRFSGASGLSSEFGERISGESSATFLSPEATAHLAAATVANRRAAVRAMVSSYVGVSAAVITWAALSYCVFAFGLRVYATLGVSAEVQVGVLWLAGIAGSSIAEWLATGVRTLASLAVSGLSELLQNRSDSAWLAAQLDFVAAAAVRERAAAKEKAAQLKAKRLAGAPSNLGLHGTSKVAPLDYPSDEDEELKGGKGAQFADVTLKPKATSSSRWSVEGTRPRASQIVPLDVDSDEDEAAGQEADDDPKAALRSSPARRWSMDRNRVAPLPADFPSDGDDDADEDLGLKKPPPSKQVSQLGQQSARAGGVRMSQVVPVDESSSDDSEEEELREEAAAQRRSSQKRMSYVSVDFSQPADEPEPEPQPHYWRLKPPGAPDSSDDDE